MGPLHRPVGRSKSDELLPLYAHCSLWSQYNASILTDIMNPRSVGRSRGKGVHTGSLVTLGEAAWTGT